MPEIDPSTRKANAVPRGLLWLRVAVTIVAWILLVVYGHHLAHLYPAEIAQFLATPGLQIATTVTLLTSLVYLVALTLPFVPRLGLRGMGMVLVWSTLLVVGHSLSHLGLHDATAMLAGVRESVGPLALMALALAYAVALALPFFPGVELGLLIMAVFGPAGALASHAATVVGLGMAFAVGRLLPARLVAAGLSRVGIVVPRNGVDVSMSGMLAQRRLTQAGFGQPPALVLDYRHLALGVCLNFPGNAAVGGGGGLALLCGLSREIGWAPFLLTVALAAAPVPILVLIGLLDMEPLMQHHGFLHDMLTRIATLFIHV